MLREKSLMMRVRRLMRVLGCVGCTVALLLAVAGPTALADTTPAADGSSFATASLPGSAEAMVETALGEPDGEPEGGRYNKYNMLLDHGGYDWCGCFITWCARTAGVSTNAIPNICLTTAMVQFYQEQGVWHDTSYTPKPGDLIFFDSGGTGYVSHVALVVGIENGYIVTKEGNTKNGQVGMSNNLPVGSEGIPQYGRHIYGFASPRYAICEHEYWHAEDTTYERLDSDANHLCTYRQVCDACGKEVGYVIGEKEACSYEWQGVKIVCAGCGAEYVMHERETTYVAQVDTAIYADETLTQKLSDVSARELVRVRGVSFANERWVGSVAMDGAAGYVRLADFKYNGNAGTHSFVNGVCVDCGVSEAPSRPGVYSVKQRAIVYEDSPISNDTEVLDAGDRVVVTEVVPSTYNWYWGITSDGRYIDMIGLEPIVERLAGETAVETSVSISAATFDHSNYVVLARDDDFADAMAATGLAGTLGAPILLTDRSVLSDDVADEIGRLGATHVFVIGGTGAISAQIDESLGQQGVTVRRVYGENSYDTSLECAKLIVELGGSPSDAIVAMSMNFQDALSMSSYAYRYKVPIILQTWGTTSADRGFTDEARAFVAGRSLLVVGGTGAISDASLEGLEVTARLWGETGYDTSNAIASWMVEHGMLKAECVVIACGAQAPKGVDALAGAALAGRLEAPLLLVNANTALGDEDLTTVYDFMVAHADELKHAYILGGSYVTPDSLLVDADALID